MKIISWNVNGLRSILSKGFVDIVASLDPDIICLQEIKVSREKIPEFSLDGYFKFFNPAERRGYSGTAVFSKKQPKIFSMETEIEKITPGHEGRVILLEYNTFFLVNVYTPNSGAELARLKLRCETWDKSFLSFISNLAHAKHVIVCGDFNVAHEEIDLTHPKHNRFNAGFTDEERVGLSKILYNGFTDAFRYQHHREPNHYTWWSYRANARTRNIGWRIDYILISDGLVDDLISSEIYESIPGSDHAPVGISISLAD